MFFFSCGDGRWRGVCVCVSFALSFYNSAERSSLITLRVGRRGRERGRGREREGGRRSEALRVCNAIAAPSRCHYMHSHTHAIGYSSEPHLFLPRGGKETKGVKEAEWRTRTTPDTHGTCSWFLVTIPLRFYVNFFPTSEKSKKKNLTHLVLFGLHCIGASFTFTTSSRKSRRPNLTQNSLALPLSWFLVRL